jgi:hypothetical protein
MSVMDMNSRMAMAEKLSVQQLQQAIQSGSLPAYIGIPLIEQKNKERSQMAAAQQGQEKPPSVASQILQQAEQGIDQLPSNLPTEQDEAMGMADGGIVAFADTGLVEGENPTIPPAAVSKYGGIESISPEGRAKFAEYEGLLKDLRGKGGSEREQAKAMAIFQAGLGMMGGTSPNAFANIAAGAMPAVTQYQSALKDIRKEDRDTLKQMLDLGVSKEQFLQKAQQMGIDVYKADRAYDATMGAARMRTAGERQPQRPTDQRAFVLDYIARARAKGVTEEQTPDAVLAVEGAERYLEQSRPVQPNVAIPTAVTARMKDDPKLQQLDIAAMKARNDPGKLKEINDQIAARIKEIELSVTTQSSQGRGTGGGGAGGGGAGGGGASNNAPKERVVNGVKYVLRADGKYYPEEK